MSQAQPKPTEYQISKILYALADPSRRRLILELTLKGEIGSQDFKSVEAARGTISFHLKTLAAAGITRTRIEGSKRLVSLRTPELHERVIQLLDAALGPYSPSAPGSWA